MRLGDNNANMQKANRCLVLRILSNVDKISRVDLARRTKLNKATITNIINEFTAMGIVEGSGAVTASNGRRTAGISLTMRDYVTIVIRITRYDLRFALCNFHGELSHHKIVPFTHEQSIEDILEKMQKYTKRYISLSKNKRLLGISIAILGWLYRDGERTIANADGFPELAKVDFLVEMRRMFPGQTVLIDHDANLSALAEWQEYAKETGNTSGSMLSIVCGIGFGAGIIIDGKLFHGRCGVAGEVGHMGINFNSRIFSPSATHYNGTYEEYACPRAIRNIVMDRLMDYPDTPLTEESTIQEIYDQYEAGDELATWAINRMAHMLSYGLTSLIFVLDPGVIVLGDEIIRSERFMRRLKTNMKVFLPPLIYESLDIRISQFQSDVILVGAGTAMTRHYLDSYEILDFIKAEQATPSLSAE